MTELSTFLSASPSTILSRADSSNSNRSPRRVSTDPTSDFSTKTIRARAKKRIIVCCDGTWQDGLGESRSMYSNVLRLSRAIDHEDARQGPHCSENGTKPRAIEQIVFYQSGIGTENNPWSEYVDGATGASLGDKVEEAYAFIAHNYKPGDDIYLFGFSRGAYTARMVAMFIGEIGVLDRNDMDHFASIFINFQRRGTEKDAKERDLIESNLAPWLDPKSKGKKRVDIDRDGFTIKCIGVWDTVGSLGLPDELIIKNPKNMLFGFSNPGQLGAHVQYAFQALALDERRKDFDCNKFVQTPAGQKKGQVLRQCWFAGCHTDIGGGYPNHDLSDISLFWMAANVESILALDIKYLESHLEPVARWGEQEPHNSVTGIFVIAKTIQRSIPAKPDEKTSESIHPSVLERISSYPKLKVAVESHPKLIWDLLVLEKQLKAFWETKYDPESSRAQAYTTQIVKRQGGFGSRISRLLSTWTLTRHDSKSDGRKLFLEQDKMGSAGTLKTGLPVIEAPPPIS